MKRGLLLLILLPVVMANPFYAEELELEIDISNQITITPEDRDWGLNRVGVMLSFYPYEDFRQNILSMDSTPSYTEKDGFYEFEWKNVKETELEFSLESRVRTTGELVKVRDKVDFPIKSLTPELREYVTVTPTIDYTDKDIIELASELAYGEDDLYVVVHKLGAWVNQNIEYDLNSKTADASQSASWVLENRYGVCDELTNLFIGLSRVLGIPARFVSGISYTNIETFDEWGAHGWAEVYFPGHGWVPYDVTYGEMGFVDATHIKLKDALDANRSSTKYEWEGHDIDLEFGRLDIDTRVIDSIGVVSPWVKLDAMVLKPEIGFESYNALVVEVKNPHDYYVPVELMITRSEGIEFFDEYFRFILLEPGETRQESWILRLEDGLEPGFIYNFTMKAYTARNASSVTSIMSLADYKEYSLQEIRNGLENQQEESQKTYSENIDIECDALSQYYVGETAEITCRLHNTGNVVLENLAVCLDECETIDLYIGQESTVSFSIKFDVEGPMDLQVTARNQQVTKSDNVKFSVWSRPFIEITGLKYPEKTRLRDNFTIEFKISPTTLSLPQNVKVKLVTSSFEKSWSVEQLENYRSYILHVNQDTLSDYVNDFKIIVDYKDHNQMGFSTIEEFKIELYDVTLQEKAKILLNKINIQLQYHFIIAVISIFAAGLVVGLIFKRKNEA